VLAPWALPEMLEAASGAPFSFYRPGGRGLQGWWAPAPWACATIACTLRATAGDPFSANQGRACLSLHALAARCHRPPQRQAHAEGSVPCSCSPTHSGLTHIGGRQFLVRQLNDHKGSIDLRDMAGGGLEAYAESAAKLWPAPRPLRRPSGHRRLYSAPATACRGAGQVPRPLCRPDRKDWQQLRPPARPGEGVEAPLSQHRTSRSPALPRSKIPSAQRMTRNATITPPRAYEGVSWISAWIQFSRKPISRIKKPQPAHREYFPAQARALSH